MTFNMTPIMKEKAKQLALKLGQENPDKKISEIDVDLEKKKNHHLSDYWDKIKMLRDSLTLDDTLLSKEKKFMIIGCLMYIILPIDVLPDMIPPFGYVDDIFVLLYVANKIIPILTEFVDENVEKLVENSFEKIYPQLDKKLKRFFVGLIISMASILLLRILRFIFLYNNTFGEIGTYYVVNTIRCVSYGYCLISITIFFIKYGDITISLTKNIINSIIKQKKLINGIDTGIAAFVVSNYPFIDKVIGGINKYKKYIPGSSKIPDLPDIVKTIRMHITNEFKAFLIFIGLIIATRIVFIFLN